MFSSGIRYRQINIADRSKSLVITLLACRCPFQTVAGRCTRVVVIGGPFCRFHTELIYGLEVRVVGFNGKLGYGVFATRRLATSLNSRRRNTKMIVQYIGLQHFRPSSSPHAASHHSIGDPVHGVDCFQLRFLGSIINTHMPQLRWKRDENGVLCRYSSVTHESYNCKLMDVRQNKHSYRRSRHATEYAVFHSEREDSNHSMKPVSISPGSELFCSYSSHNTPWLANRECMTGEYLKFNSGTSTWEVVSPCSELFERSVNSSF